MLCRSGDNEYLNFSALPTNYVFTHALYVFTTDRWDLYAVVQSTSARSLGAQIQWRAGDTTALLALGCFDTFPSPKGCGRQPI